MVRECRSAARRWHWCCHYGHCNPACCFLWMDVMLRTDQRTNLFFPFSEIKHRHMLAICIEMMATSSIPCMPARASVAPHCTPSKTMLPDTACAVDGVLEIFSCIGECLTNRRSDMRSRTNTHTHTHLRLNFLLLVIAGGAVAASNDLHRGRTLRQRLPISRPCMVSKSGHPFLQW